jgi:hypothetical protein
MNTYTFTSNILTISVKNNIQCVWKVAVHLGYGMVWYGTSIWLSVLKLLLKCAVVSLYSVVKQWLKCNAGKVFV